MDYPQGSGGRAKKKRTLLIAIPAVLLLALVSGVLISAHRALRRASLSVAAQGKLSFTLLPLDIHPPNSGVELIASDPSYIGGAALADSLYLAGPTGLTVLSSNGTPRLTLRTGLELPVALITAIATGRLRGMTTPQVLLATHGAGLLLLEPGATPTIHQLLPADADARDLTALAPLPTGEILLGTRNHGILIYNGDSLKLLHFTLPGIHPAALQITALKAIDASAYLIGTRNNGVFYLHAGTVDHLTTDTGLPDNQIESFALNATSTHAFVGTPTGTVELDLTTQTAHTLRALGKGLFAHALAVDEHELTIGTLDQGIQQVPLDGRPHLRNISLATNTGTSQRIDGFFSVDNSLYALADGRLLRRTNNAWSATLPTSNVGLTDRNISALAFAPDGTLYIGFFDHGLDLLSPQGAIHHLEDDHLFCINRLALAPERHTIAAATADGLVLFDDHGTPRQTLTRRDGLISDHITDVAFTPSGTVAATPAGITFLGPTGAESLYAFQGLVNNHVYALASSGQLLAGTLGGLSILQSGKVQHNLTVTNSGLKHNWITALLPLPDHKFLIGTYGAGLATLDNQSHISSVELPTDAPRDLVINPNALFATPTHLYAGTLGHGMLVYSNATGRWSSVTSGLPSLNVTAFAARNGSIYVGTENGLVRMAESSLP